VTVREGVIDGVSVGVAVSVGVGVAEGGGLGENVRVGRGVPVRSCAMRVRSWVADGATVGVRTPATRCLQAARVKQMMRSASVRVCVCAMSPAALLQCLDRH
jgi:hypothetical protein